jgi:UPF0716 family protein affecting phage T7 exclusion
MLDWIRDNPVLLSWLFGAGVAIFVASLFIVPAVIVRMPPDYFAHRKRPVGQFGQSHRAIRIAYKVGKTLLGVLLIAAGMAMLVLPGQGLLTMLIGFFLLEFPGKYRLEQWLVSRPRVLKSINWLRKRAKREPLQVRKGLDEARQDRRRRRRASQMAQGA